MKEGITIAGTAVVDHNNIINDYPNKGMLANISNVFKHVGGCVPNTSLILRKLTKDIPIQAISTIGNDSDGDFLMNQLKENDIDTDHIVQIDSKRTGFTDVMTVKNTGERTFFTHEGANEIFSENHLMIPKLNSKLFHIGYVFLLKELDQLNESFGTNLAESLYKIQSRDIKTSIDLVSVKVDDYSERVIPALKYTNYFIANEVESGMITQVDPYNAKGKISEKNIKKILLKLLNFGVNDLVVIHSPEGGWAIDKEGNYYYSQSIDLPKAYIKSSVGAGDAFCAGMLYSIYHDLEIEKSLEIANTVAAMGLGGFDSFSNIQSIDQIEAFTKKILKKED